MPFGALKQMEEKPLKHEIYKQIYIKFPLFFFLLFHEVYCKTNNFVIINLYFKYSSIRLYTFSRISIFGKKVIRICPFP